MNTVLVLNHSEKSCGVYQFCRRVYDLIKTSKNVNYIYKEVGSHAEYLHIKKQINPDFILYNWHPLTMSWLTEDMVSTDKTTQHYFIYHDLSTRKNYDKYLFFGVFNPNNFNISEDRGVLLPRPLMEYKGEYRKNDVPNIGSFGFGFWDKGFPGLVTKVNKTFDNAVLNIHIPFAYFGDAQGKTALSIAEDCRKKNIKPGIQLNITHNFLDEQDMLTFLAGNDINVFNYGERAAGLSSVTDYALSVKRPMAITRCNMFKHLIKDDIILEKNSILEILNKGTAPLEDFYDRWSIDNFRKAMDNVFLGNYKGESFNKLLKDRDRNALNPLIKEMKTIIPEMMSRKIEEAHVQSAIVVDFIRKSANRQTKMLCVGSHEDTTCEFLIKQGYDITFIDPVLNCDLHTFFTSTERKFDLIFSVSVLEHVKDDEEFIDEICKLLNPRGKAILTCDFKEGFKMGDPNLSVEERFYTTHDIVDRLGNLLKINNCEFLNTPDFSGNPDFKYETLMYSFAVFSFQKD